MGRFSCPVYLISVLDFAYQEAWSRVLGALIESLTSDTAGKCYIYKNSLPATQKKKKITYRSSVGMNPPPPPHGYASYKNNDSLMMLHANVDSGSAPSTQKGTWASVHLWWVDKTMKYYWVINRSEAPIHGTVWKSLANINAKRPSIVTEGHILQDSADMCYL